MYFEILNQWWTQLYFLLLRPMLKWFLRKVTGKCELLRICYEENDKVKRTKRTEHSLKHSGDPEVKKCAVDINFDVTESVKRIQVMKDVLHEVHPRFETSLQDCLLRIRAYNIIIAEAEELRKTKFVSGDEAHEAKLRRLWQLYNGETPLTDRIGHHWTEIGFQGNDPSTDFRGMGMLGLEQMIYFASSYPDEAKHVLSQSHHPQYGFSFAIVSINITEMGFTLLSKRKLRCHFYGLDVQEPGLEDFHKVHSHLLYEFVQFWMSEKPKDIMEYSRLREKFRRSILESLRKPDCRLLSPFQKQKS